MSDASWRVGYPKAFLDGLDFFWVPSMDGHQEDSAPTESFRTSWGITPPIWNAGLAQGVVHGDLENATQEQCAALFFVFFFNALRLTTVPEAIAFTLFVESTLTGTGHVAKLLQRIVGTAQDGIVGSLTLTAMYRYIVKVGTKAMLDAIVDGDEVYEKSLPNAATYIGGWIKRDEEERLAAYKFAGIEAA